jgi:sulfur carrier protein
MKITVNGKQVDCLDGITVSGLLAEQKVKAPEMVSVELNGRILRRADFVGAILKNHDEVEFLYFMGGGAK